MASLASASAARAADWYTGAGPTRPASDWIVAVDASVSAASSGSQFAAISATVAPVGTLSTSGPRFRLEGLAGTYTFNLNGQANRITGEQFGGAVLGGYQWQAPRATLSLFGGVDIRDSRFSTVAPGLPASGLREGFKAVAEYYATPSDQSMVFAYGSYSTIFNAYYTRAKWGYSAFQSVYVGPEVLLLGDDFYRQWRIGAHLTGFQLSAFQLGISGGYLLDKNGKGGAYGMLDVRSVF